MPPEIVTVDLPESIDEDSSTARIFRGFVDVRNAVRREAWGGSGDLDFSYREMFFSARDGREVRQHRYAAVSDGEVVGIARVEVSLHESEAPARLMLGVLPAARRQGIGTALLAAAESALAAEGRRFTQLGTEHPEAPGPRLHAAARHGSIPANNPEAIALQRFGFRFEQAERASRFVFSADSAAILERALERAQRSQDGYRLETWKGKTPAPWLATMAELGARMSTDAPSGEMATAEEVWDADRLAEFESNEIDKQGRRYLHAVAFVGDEAVAFTKLMLPPTGTTQAIQQDTLVRSDHRGRRLGLAVKAANLLQLQRLYPEFDRVVTWNAAENTHMLAVNDELGFTPVLVEGEWQREEKP